LQYDGLSAAAGDDSAPGGTFWYLFSQYNLLLDFTYPLMASLFVYLTLIFVNYFKEQKQRQQIRAAFGFYLSPALVEQLARSPGSPRRPTEFRSST
jgi:adenylate cyclase